MLIIIFGGGGGVFVSVTSLHSVVFAYHTLKAWSVKLLADIKPVKGWGSLFEVT